MAKGDILGCFISECFNLGESGASEIADLAAMAVTLSEYLSLSIANVKLSESLSRTIYPGSQKRVVQPALYGRIAPARNHQSSSKLTPIGIIMEIWIISRNSTTFTPCGRRQNICRSWEII